MGSQSHHIGKTHFGWAFVYNRGKFWETEDPMDSIVGNGPVLFVRETDGMGFCGSGYPIEKLIADFEAGLINLDIIC